ncbi:hypothetical protein DP187_21445 [Enterobacter cloacae]|nr:hypothetical protein DP187_21445 [Enterobacter cloacae]
MKKQMTELEAKEFLQAASTGHLVLSSINAANPNEFKKKTFWIDIEMAKAHRVLWRTTREGMGASPK